MCGAAGVAQLPAWAAGCLIWAVWVCAARVSGMPPGGLIVGVRVVLGVLLPVLRRGVVLLICA